jgi:hypothetical protein
LNPDRPICLEARQKKFEMAGSSWSIQETRALLNLWGDGRVQAELGIAVRNKAIFERIQRDFSRLGYDRTWQQCRVKIKNLTATYRKIKDNNNRSGRGRSDFPFYDDLDRVWVTGLPPDQPICYPV